MGRAIGICAAGALAAGALVAGILSCAPEPADRPGAAPRQAAALVVTRGALAQRVLLAGELEAVKSEKLTPPPTEAGRLTVQWLGEDGSAVEAGDRLVEFDTAAIVETLRELELQELEAKNSLISTKAQATIDEVQKRIEVENQRVAVAKAKLDARIPKDMVAARDWQEYQLALERARTALATAEEALAAQLEAARHEERVKQIALEKIQRKIQRIEGQVDALVLKAPRAGILVIAEHPWRGRKFQVGDNVWPSIAVAKVPDLSKMQVRAGLSDVDDGGVQPGMKGTCVLDARPDEPHECEVISVSPVAREPSEDSRRRFFDVQVALAETDPEVMRPGMSVRVEVVAREIEDALIAPRAGLDLEADPPEAALRSGGSAALEVIACTPRACAVEGDLEEGTELRRIERGAP